MAVIGMINGIPNIILGQGKPVQTASMFSYDNPYHRELGDVSFEIKRYEDLDPFSISFQDYKKLNTEALETIFNKNTKEYSQALSLMGSTAIFDDDILNKIFFDEKVKSKGEGEELRYMQFVPGSILLENSYENHDYEFNTAEKFFKEFDRIKSTFSVPEGHSREKVIATMDYIKSEYKRRLEENESLLQELTRNSKPTLVEVKESTNG